MSDDLTAFIAVGMFVVGLIFLALAASVVNHVW